VRGKLFLDHRILVALLAFLLSALLLLVSMASPPTVPISQVFSFDDGSVVVLIGVLVDISLRDGGAESLVLVDITDGATVRVYCNPGLHEQPSHYLSIGDEVRVQGEVSSSGSSPILFTTSDSIALSKSAESVLSMEALCRNWALFEGDSFRTNGLIIDGEVTGSYRLSDPEMKHSVLLRSNHIELASYVGKRVSLTAVLRLDPNTMSLVLIASSLSPDLS
jgi:hypothetical protein